MTYLLFVLFFILFILLKLLKYKLDPKNNKSIFSFCKSLYSISKSLLLLKFPWLSNTQKISLSGKSYLKISYSYNNIKYFFLSKIKRVLYPISTIHDENNTNIYDSISPYLGPNMDCHGVTLTPEDFGYEKIIIRNTNEEEKIFNKHDKICF